MSEVNGKTLSISFRIDEGVIEHNNRIFIAKNVDGERVQDNITYCRQDIREKYDELFGQALAEYNARQKQASRRIPDYYEHLKKSSKRKPYYEIVVRTCLPSCRSVVMKSSVDANRKFAQLAQRRRKDAPQQRQARST